MSLIEKSMKKIKEGDDEKKKNDLPKSIKILSEEINGNTAVVEAEITSKGGEVKRQKVEMKKDKHGDWKITNGSGIEPDK